MLMIFLIYWRLPNRKIPMKRLIPASAVVAILLEVSKYVKYPDVAVAASQA